MVLLQLLSFLLLLLSLQLLPSFLAVVLISIHLDQDTVLQSKMAVRAFQYPFSSSLQNLKLISILVNKGKLQEHELESVLNFLFPTK